MSFDQIKDPWFTIEDEDGDKHFFVLKPSKDIKDSNLYRLEIIPCMHCECVAKIIIRYDENNTPTISIKEEAIQIYRDPTMVL